MLLADLKPGTSVDLVVLVASGQARQTKKHTTYFDLNVRDASAQLNAKVWAVRKGDEVPKAGDFLGIKATVEEYREDLQLNIDDFQYIPRDKVDIAAFLPSAERPALDMWADLHRLIQDDIQSDEIRLLLTTLVTDPKLKEALLRSPAGVLMHHATVGGLLEHILSMWNCAKLIHQNYPWVKRDVLLAGTVVHDIGKTVELSVDTAFEYTPLGKLAGHVLIGTHILWSFCTKLKISKPVMTELMHIIASHHGDEHGATKPQTAEAVVFHYIDALDSRMGGIKPILDRSPESGFTERVPILGRELYR